MSIDVYDGNKNRNPDEYELNDMRLGRVSLPSIPDCVKNSNAYRYTNESYGDLQIILTSLWIFMV